MTAIIPAAITNKAAAVITAATKKATAVIMKKANAATGTKKLPQGKTSDAPAVFITGEPLMTDHSSILLMTAANRSNSSAARA